jgi:hypothetical protein
MVQLSIDMLNSVEPQIQTDQLQQSASPSSPMRTLLILVNSRPLVLSTKFDIQRCLDLPNAAEDNTSLDFSGYTWQKAAISPTG